MDGSLGADTGPCRYSLVVPIFNEAETLPALVEHLGRLMDGLDGPAEAVLVDDGSRDGSRELVRRAGMADPRFKLVSLSRNFGHQIAITAGMDFARGDAVIVMDADLQDPPEVVPRLIEKWREGFDVVYAVRTDRQGESAFKRWTAHLFYRVIGALSSVSIPPDVGDFRLVDRRALAAFGSMRERDRFVRGMFAWMGLKQAGVPFARHARRAGETKYPLRRMLRLAVSGIIGFSDAPLRLAIWLGVAVLAGAFVYGAFVIAAWALGAELVAGWTSTIILVSILGGVNLVMTGITGLYVGRIHEEVKNRPLYVVDELFGVATADAPAGAHLATRPSAAAARTARGGKRARKGEPADGR